MKPSSTLAEAQNSKIISLDAARRIRDLSTKDEEYAYQARILGMDKLALLEEMVRFQQERSRNGELTLEMIARGKYLFKALEERAETQELQLLARSYRRHLDHEMSLKLQQG
jgi:hypothetical protein